MFPKKTSVDGAAIYEGPAKSFVTGFGLLQCYVLSNIFYYKPSKYPPFTETHFCNFLPSREKQIIVFFWYLLETLINSAAKRTSRRLLISRKHFLKPWK